VTHARVPPLPTWLLRSLLPHRDRDAMRGDLSEEYTFRSSASIATARRWYWSQVCRSIPPVLIARIRRDNWPLTMLVALGLYVLVGVFNRAGGILVASLLGARLATYAVSGVIVGLMAIASGGYVAARIRPGAAGVLGGLVVIVAVALMASPSDPAPLWYQMIFFVLGPLAAHAGGAVASVRRARD
jgi:hypothetical protein